VNEDSTDKHADAPLYHNELLTTPHRNKINKFKKCVFINCLFYLRFSNLKTQAIK